MFALVMIVVSLSDVLALESHHIRDHEGIMIDTTRDLKKDKEKKQKCKTGTQANVYAWCATNNCCKGVRSCDYMDGTITVCAGACNGWEACAFMGPDSVINSGACVGFEACWRLGKGAAAKAVTVGAGACVGEYACEDTGLGSVTKINIGAGACKGDSSCYGLGNYGATKISVAAGACIGGRSCNSCDETSNVQRWIKGQECPVV
jgi:hypothetical protein